jgi:hypothetical protein
LIWELDLAFKRVAINDVTTAASTHNWIGLLFREEMV